MDLVMYPAQAPSQGYVANLFAHDGRRGPARYTWQIERRTVRNFHPPRDHFCIRKLVASAWTSSVLPLEISYDYETWKRPETIIGELNGKMINGTDRLEEVLSKSGDNLCGLELHSLAQAMAACPYQLEQISLSE